MRDIDLGELGRVALAVTPGPWEVFDRTLITDTAGLADGLADVCDEDHAAFIAAANPATILDLIHRLRTAEAAVAQGQADLLALSTALAEARDNDRAAMGWLVDARAAAGDDGKRMLPEFVEYLKGLKADAERYVTIREDILGVGAEDGVGQELERLLIRVMNERGVDAIPTNAEFDSAVDMASKNNSV